MTHVSTTQIERAAAAMMLEREQMIDKPLARIWHDLAKAALESSPTSWQDIDRAPKDGRTQVDLWMSSSERVTGCWWDARQQVWVHWWADGYGSICETPVVGAATHFMLPPPPPDVPPPDWVVRVRERAKSEGTSP